MKTVAIQLSCYNGSRYLPYLLSSLAAQTYTSWKLYVLDNASSKEEVQSIKKAIEDSGIPAVYERIESNIGFAGAHNHLFKKHDDPYVLLLNDDAILEEGYVQYLVEYLEEHPKTASVSGRIYRWNFDRRNEGDGGKTKTIDSFGLERKPNFQIVDHLAGEEDSDPSRLGEPQEVFGVSGCLPLYRRSAIVETSPTNTLFDTRFVIYKEDVEAAWRLREAGYTSVVVPGAIAYHRRSFGKGGHAKQSFENNLKSYRNNLWLLLMHVRLGEGMRHAWRFLPFELAKAGYWLLNNPRVLWNACQETWNERHNLLQKRRFYQSLGKSVPRV